VNLFILFIQTSLAILMGYYAIPKLIFSKNKLKIKGGQKMNYVDNLSSTSLIIIGILELFTSVGFFLSILKEDYMWLCTLSCIMIIFTMIGAIFLHLKRKDGLKPILVNFLYIFMSSIVLYGNFYI